jgi:ferritin-like protein
MTDSSAQLHEPADQLRPETVELHRAVVSLIEEFEAIDWYSQRIDATTDADLRGVLAHNREEEKEHAVMTLEWLRRRDPELDLHLRRYLFTDGPIARLEDESNGTATRAADAGHGELRIGALSEAAS